MARTGIPPKTWKPIARRLSDWFSVYLPRTSAAARKLRRTEAQVSRWKNGGQMDLATVIDLAHKTGLSLDWLLMGREEEALWQEPEPHPWWEGNTDDYRVMNAVARELRVTEDVTQEELVQVISVEDGKDLLQLATDYFRPTLKERVARFRAKDPTLVRELLDLELELVGLANRVGDEDSVSVARELKRLAKRTQRVMENREEELTVETYPQAFGVEVQELLDLFGQAPRTVEEAEARIEELEREALKRHGLEKPDDG